MTLAHCCKAQCFHKESQGYMNILYGQPAMMNTLGGADNGLHGSLLPVLKTQNGQAWGIVGTAPEIPVKSPVTGNYGMFIDAGNTSLHQTVIRKFPIFIAVGSEPLVGVGAVFIGKANCNAITIMGPQFLYESIVQLSGPFAFQKGNDGPAADDEFGTVPPDTVRRIGQSNSGGGSTVPAIFRKADFFRCTISGEWG